MTFIDTTLSHYTDQIVVNLNHVLTTLPAVLFSLLLGILIVKVLASLTRFVLRLTNLQVGLQQVVGSAVEIVMWLILVINTLKALGFADIVTFFASSALAIGILLAAGGTTLLSDIIAGLFLARDTDFNVGDRIIAGENQTEGIIEAIDARRTRLRSDDDRLHIIPNSVVERKEWVLLERVTVVSPLLQAVETARKVKAVAVAKAARKPVQRRVVRKNE